MWLSFLFYKGIKQRDHFQTPNVRLIRLLGILLIAKFVANACVASYKWDLVNGFFEANRYPVNVQISVDSFQIAVVIFLFIFAEIMRAGQVIDEEHKMTI